MTDATDLSKRTCEACRGGIPPMSAKEASVYLEKMPNWTLTHNGSRIERSLEFPDFAQTLAFVNKVGELAEAEGHHPDIKFGWGYCTIELYTHKIGGLHGNDLILAAKIDELD